MNHFRNPMLMIHTPGNLESQIISLNNAFTTLNNIELLLCLGADTKHISLLFKRVMRSKDFFPQFFTREWCEETDLLENLILEKLDVEPVDKDEILRNLTRLTEIIGLMTSTTKAVLVDLKAKTGPF